MTEALKLKKDELETNEFSMIYDQEEKLSNEDLIKKIDGKVVEVDWLICLNWCMLLIVLIVWKLTFGILCDCIG